MYRVRLGHVLEDLRPELHTVVSAALRLHAPELGDREADVVHAIVRGFERRVGVRVSLRDADVKRG